MLAAREIMRLAAATRGLGRRAELHTAKASSEEALHPRADTERFEEPGDWKGRSTAATCGRSREDAPRSACGATRAWASCAAAGGRAALYRALRPGAFALAVYMARLTREASRVRRRSP